MSSIRTYRELSRLSTFQDRYEYLRLGGMDPMDGINKDRAIKQAFYRTYEWEHARKFVILRDNGCDLGIPGRDIFENPVVHHINVMTAQDITNGEEWIIDPEFLITTTHDTHNAIHYSADVGVPLGYVERQPGDTKSW